MDAMVGREITLVSEGVMITVRWFQNRRAREQLYRICVYKLRRYKVTVYIQQDFKIPNQMRVESPLQYGEHNGRIFLVYHDKSQTPYQHRFSKRGLHRRARGLHDGLYALQNALGVGVGSVIGDNLHDIPRLVEEVDDTGSRTTPFSTMTAGMIGGVVKHSNFAGHVLGGFHVNNYYDKKK